MQFTLKITLSNDAMQTFDDVRERVAVSLRKAAEFYGGDAEPMLGAGGFIRDANGNAVGNWEVSE